MNPRKLFARISGGSVSNIRFGDFVGLVEHFGFTESHTRGSHRYFEHPEVPEILSLQPRGGDAKEYQVRQFLDLVHGYNLQIRGSDQ